VKEKGEKEKDKVSVPLAYEIEQYMGNHWLCDWSSKEGCKHNIHGKGLIQESIGIMI
jgi:hypothetical protein